MHNKAKYPNHPLLARLLHCASPHLTHLVSVVRPNSEGNTVTTLHHLGSIVPGQTISSELLSLTVGGSLPQPGEVLRHSDGLDVCQDVVTLPVQS